MAAVPARSCEKAVQVGANFEPEPQKIGFSELDVCFLEKYGQ